MRDFLSLLFVNIFTWALSESYYLFFAVTVSLQLFSLVLLDKNYLKSLFHLVVFALRIVLYFFYANLQVAYQILTVPPSKMTSKFETMDIKNLRRLESLLLSHLITLTPGTVTTELSGDSKTITIHTLAPSDTYPAEASIRKNIILPMLRWSR